MSDALTALRAANPRADARFAKSVQAVADTVRARGTRAAAPPRRRLVGLSAAGAALTALAAAAVVVLVGSPGGQNATAAFERASALTTASAERSGTAVVRITHDGRPWAGRTIRWNGDDLSLAGDAPQRGKRAGVDMLVVGGTVYGIEPGLGWVAMGSPENIDPGSGTTPDEYLAAVREDVGGVTLQRITNGMSGLTATHLDDGSTVYRGQVAAGRIARETGFKQGEAIRVLPFGYVAHDQAANPSAPLDVAVTVGRDNLVRELVVSWGTWVYRVAYSRLGATPAPAAPKNARSLLELRARAQAAGAATGRP